MSRRVPQWNQSSYPGPWKETRQSRQHFSQILQLLQLSQNKLNKLYARASPAALQELQPLPLQQKHAAEVTACGRKLQLQLDRRSAAIKGPTANLRGVWQGQTFQSAAAFKRTVANLSHRPRDGQAGQRSTAAKGFASNFGHWVGNSQAPQRSAARKGSSLNLSQRLWQGQVPQRSAVVKSISPDFSQGLRGLPSLSKSCNQQKLHVPFQSTWGVLGPSKSCSLYTHPSRSSSQTLGRSSPTKRCNFQRPRLRSPATTHGWPPAPSGGSFERQRLQSESWPSGMRTSNKIRSSQPGADLQTHSTGGSSENTTCRRVKMMSSTRKEQVETLLDDLGILSPNLRLKSKSLKVNLFESRKSREV